MQTKKHRDRGCVLSRSPEHTMEIGRILAERILPGDILAFCGDLGAGKTCFIRGVCHGLGVPEDAYITSPSFVILNRYNGRLPIYHFDFYRLSCQDEILGLGYEECFFDEGVCLIEWADRAKGLLPESYLMIEIHNIAPSVRRIEFTIYGSDYIKRYSDIARGGFDKTGKELGVIRAIQLS